MKVTKKELREMIRESLLNEEKSKIHFDYSPRIIKFVACVFVNEFLK